MSLSLTRRSSRASTSSQATTSKPRAASAGSGRRKRKPASEEEDEDFENDSEDDDSEGEEWTPEKEDKSRKVCTRVDHYYPMCGACVGLSSVFLCTDHGSRYRVLRSSHTLASFLAPLPAHLVRFQDCACA